MVLVSTVYGRHVSCTEKGHSANRVPLEWVRSTVYLDNGGGVSNREGLSITAAQAYRYLVSATKLDFVWSIRRVVRSDEPRIRRRRKVRDTPHGL